MRNKNNHSATQQKRMARKRKRRNNGNRRIIGFLIVVLIALAVNYLTDRQEQQKSKGHVERELAIPRFTRATESQTIEHTGYIVSYNQGRRNPNWVAYELTADEVEGEEPRDGDFTPDPDVRGCQAADDDYRRSGWDRGHLAPAADMKWSEQAMKESFYLSNISPQNNNLNRGVWKSIEELTRNAAKRYNNVLVVTGPVFKSEKGKGTIGDNKVVIPDAFYKVLLINDFGHKGIGFYCENVAGKRKLNSYARSIDEIEEITGIDFFHRLPDEIEEKTESEYDWELWK